MIVTCKVCHQTLDAHENHEARIFLMEHLHLDNEDE